MEWHHTWSLRQATPCFRAAAHAANHHDSIWLRQIANESPLKRSFILTFSDFPVAPEICIFGATAGKSARIEKILSNRKRFFVIFLFPPYTPAVRN